MIRNRHIHMPDRRKQLQEGIPTKERMLLRDNLKYDMETENGNAKNVQKHMTENQCEMQYNMHVNTLQQQKMKQLNGNKNHLNMKNISNKKRYNLEH